MDIFLKVNNSSANKVVVKKKKKYNVSNVNIYCTEYQKINN